MAVSISCLSAAAIALWRQHLDAAFVIATVGALAWFLSYRSRLKDLITEPDMPANEASESNQSNEN